MGMLFRALSFIVTRRSRSSEIAKAASRTCEVKLRRSREEVSILGILERKSSGMGDDVNRTAVFCHPEISEREEEVLRNDEHWGA
jgi:hypothetical protein